MRRALVCGLVVGERSNMYLLHITQSFLGDHSLSHMIVDCIFDAAPRPFEEEGRDRDYLNYETFIYFM
jgi:hypothetical protein